MATVPENVDLPDEWEDLELCCSEGRAARWVRRYRIRIDRDPHVVHVTKMTGQQLLELAGICDLAKWKVFQKLCGQLVEVAHDEWVDFTAKGVEKFKTLPCDQTEGESSEVSR